MPTILPLPSKLPAPQGGEQRRMVRFGFLLCVLLALPVAALLVLESVLASRCATTVEAQGVLIEKTFWRIERKDCAGAKLPFYDVLIGVEGKAFASALTGRGEPRPVAVQAAGPGMATILLSAPLGGMTAVNLTLRRSGTPKERIDLESLTARPSQGAPR